MAAPLSNVMLGRQLYNMGVHSYYLAGFPSYNTACRRDEYPRYLYHSGLDEVIYYPQVPTKTLSFGLDLLSRPDWVEAKTLTSNLRQQWGRVAEDVLVKEVFSGDLSQQQSFFYSVYRHWVTILGVNEYGLWRPMDRTDLVYRVRVIEMLLDGQEFNPTGVGISQPDKWMTSTMEIWLALMPSLSPSVAIFGTGPNT